MPRRSDRKMRHCAQCGVEIGVFGHGEWQRGDTCGAVDCDRNARLDALAEREEAHESLDRHMGWN